MGNADWKENARKRREKSLIVTNLAQILEIYSETPTAVHLVNLLRSKGVVVGKNKDGSPKYRDGYHITESEMLKILESYREELDRDAIESLLETEDNE